MKTMWTVPRLQRLLQRYNRKFWNSRLTGWTAEFSRDHLGGFGFCNRTIKRILVRLETHTSDRQVRATLVHEMAHAASNVWHGKRWRLEMQRLKRAGAPTESLDFLVPYSARHVVTSFMDAASAGESWEAATLDLGPLFHLCDEFGNPIDARTARILWECKRFFHIAKRRMEAR